MRNTVIVLIVLSAAVSVGAQDRSNALDAGAAVSNAWSILESALREDSIPDVAQALNALAAIGTPRALSLVERTARNGSPLARSAATFALPSDAAHLDLFSEALEDPDPRTRQVAVQRLRFSDPRVLPVLRDVLLGNDVEVLDYAIGTVEGIAPLSLGLLLECLQSCDDVIRPRAALSLHVLVSPDFRPAAAGNLDALRQLRPEPVLRAALMDADVTVRSAAAFVLARIGDSSGIRELLQLAESDDSRSGSVLSKQSAMAALHWLGWPGWLERLAEAIRDDDPAVRMDAAHAMWAFPHPSMSQLLTTTWHGSSDVRCQAFSALMTVSNRDPALLRTGLSDRDPCIRLVAARALLDAGQDAAAVDVLEQLVIDGPPRAVPMDILAKTGDARRTISIAVSLLPKSLEEVAGMSGHHSVYDPEQRISAIVALEVLGSEARRVPEAVPALASLFGPDRYVNQRVARARAAIADEAAQRALIESMNHPELSVRIHAAGGVISAFGR